MRRFVLVRDTDVTGISGEGVVVWGICFPDGTCAYRWNSKWRTTCVADGIDVIEAVHGHDGATRVVWLEDEEAGRAWLEYETSPAEEDDLDGRSAA